MKIVALAALAALALAAPATAATYSSSFGTSASTWASNYDSGPPVHYFFFAGANVSQSYTGTGLSSVASLDLVVPFTQGNTEPLTFTFSINAIDVGTWTIAAGDGSGSAPLSYSFGSVAGLGGGDYTLGLRVTTPVCSGCGYVGLDENAPISFTLTSGSTVPEPASWALLITGFGLTGAAMRRRRTAVTA